MGQAYASALKNPHKLHRLKQGLRGGKGVEQPVFSQHIPVGEALGEQERLQQVVSNE